MKTNGLTFDRFLKQFDSADAISADKDVNHPDRYVGASVTGRKLLRILGLSDGELALECIDFIEFNQLNFVEGSLVKYLWRAGEKGNTASCLNKAKWYAARQLYNQRSESGFWSAIKSIFIPPDEGIFKSELLLRVIKAIDVELALQSLENK